MYVPTIWISTLPCLVLSTWPSPWASSQLCPYLLTSSHPVPALPNPSIQGSEIPRYVWNPWTVIEGRCSTWAEANIQYWHDPTWSKFPVEWHSAATIMTQCIEAFEKLQVQCGIINPLKIPLHSNVRWGTAYQMLSVSYNIRHICHPSYYCSCNYPSRCRQSISSLPLLIIAMAISQLFNVRAMWSKRYRGLPFSLPIRTGEWCKMPHKSLW